MINKPTLIIACVQITTTDDVARNVQKVNHYINSICVFEPKVDLILFPENVFFMRDPSTSAKYNCHVYPEVIQDLCRKAKAREIAIHIGSFPESIAGSDKVYNASVIIHKDGSLGPVYRKIHLFNLVTDKLDYRESNDVMSGDSLVMDMIDGWRIGLSICYDVRFPELYRLLSEKQMEIALVPSAFTSFTGPDHWEALLRSRAIENQCYVIAAAQWGKHNSYRQSYGHSVVIDPWGQVMKEHKEGEGIIICQLNKNDLGKIRSILPALNDRKIKSGFKYKILQE